MKKLTVSRRLEYLLIAGITLIAVLARFYRITVLPPGLHFDEAFENVQALGILNGPGFPVFFEGNYGVEPTFICLIALYYRLFGAHAIAGRLIAAAVGSLTVPALHLLVRTVFRREGRDRAVLLGLLSALSLALLYWHIHFSRLGIESILVPLNVILALYFLWQGLETARPLSFILSGALVGFGPYTYPAGRLLPVLVAIVGIHWLIAHRDRLVSGKMRVQYVRGILLAVAAALVVFAPLGLYFYNHPGLLTQRMGQVGITSEGQGNESSFQTIGDNLERTLTMYTVTGDEDPRNNVPGRPVLDLLWVIFFFVGLSACIVRILRPSYGLLLWWLIVMSIPTVLSEYAPHFRRALGASPAVAVLMALGMVILLEWLLSEPEPDPYTEGVDAVKERGFRDRVRPYMVVGLLALFWLLGAASSLYDYFAVWSSDPALYYAFDVGLRDIGGHVRDLPEDELAYLSPVRQDHQTLIFTVGQAYRPKSFDGRRVLVLPPEGRAATYLNLVEEDRVSPRGLSTYLPDLAEVRRFRDAAGGVYAVVRRVPESHTQRVNPAMPVQAVLGGAVGIRGVDIPPGPFHPGDTLVVTVYWRAADEVARDYTASVQLHGPFNPATNGLLWAQEDAQPGKGTYPTTRWTSGETVIESYSLPIPADAPPGTYTLHAAMYWLPTLERLPAARDGQPIGDSVPLAEVEIAGGTGE